MNTAGGHWLETFLLGWKELVAMGVILLVVSFLLTWIANRRLRPVDRGPALNVPMFLAAFALYMIAHHVQDDRMSALIIAGGLVVAGVVISKSGTRAPVISMIMLAVLLGYGLHLSALVLFVTAFLFLLFSGPASK